MQRIALSLRFEIPAAIKGRLLRPEGNQKCGVTLDDKLQEDVDKLEQKQEKAARS